MSSAKHKGKGPQSLTANTLRDGLSVWLTPEFEWSMKYAEALATEDDDVIEKMEAFGEKSEHANDVVAPYFIDVEVETGLPVRYREKFRVRGPSYDTATLVPLDIQKV